MHTLTLNIKDNAYNNILYFLKNLSQDIEIVSDKKIQNNDEQAEIENMLNSRTSEDKEVAFSKIIEIDV